MKNERDTVIGIFPDKTQAQAAVTQLQAAGFKANIAERGQRDAFDGFDADEAGLYESRAREGNALVTVKNASNRGEDAMGIMLQAGAENIEMVANSSGQSATGAYMGQDASTTGSTQRRDANYYKNLKANQREYGIAGQGNNAEQNRVQLREETLSATKQATQAGEVELHKVVHEKEQQIPVNLAHEEVTITRHAVDRPLQAGEITDLKDEVIRVPVYEEQAQLQKQARVREEVEIKKQVVNEQQTLSGTTKHEHLEVQQSGDVIRENQAGSTSDNMESDSAR